MQTLVVSARKVRVGLGRRVLQLHILQVILDYLGYSRRFLLGIAFLSCQSELNGSREDNACSVN